VALAVRTSKMRGLSDDPGVYVNSKRALSASASNCGWLHEGRLY
jgi:hypothetical protein